MSISFENYRKVHPYEDSDSSEDEVDWQDTRHDPYRAGEVHCWTGRGYCPEPAVNLCVCCCPVKPQAAPRRGFSGKGKNITTKHDEDACGRKNTARMDNVSPSARFCLVLVVVMVTSLSLWPSSPQRSTWGTGWGWT